MPEPEFERISLEEQTELLRRPREITEWILTEAARRGDSSEKVIAVTTHLLETNAMTGVCEAAKEDPRVPEAVERAMKPVEEDAAALYQQLTDYHNRPEDILLACVLTLESFGISGKRKAVREGQ